MTTVAEALARARELGVDRLDAQLLAGHVLQRPRTWLLAHDDAELATADLQAIDALLQRRAAGEPVAYLVGEKEFHGLVLRVTRAVLVPRPDTETLVEWALERLRAGPARPRVIDLGTGSGAIALAVKHARPAAHVTALDTSAEALAIARENAQRLGLDVRLAQGDWWAAAGSEPYDLVLSNPPYIAEGDAHLPALRHEPELALTSGRDGLDAIRAIVAGAPAHLVRGGWLLFEHGHDQGEAVRGILRSAGFAGVETRPDLSGQERCTGGQWVGCDTCCGIAAQAPDEPSSECRK